MKIRHQPLRLFLWLWRSIRKFIKAPINAPQVTYPKSLLNRELSFSSEKRRCCSRARNWSMKPRGAMDPKLFVSMKPSCIFNTGGHELVALAVILLTDFLISARRRLKPVAMCSSKPVQASASTRFTFSISSVFQHLRPTALVRCVPFFLMKARYEAVLVSCAIHVGRRARTSMHLLRTNQHL
jgi:hypothetical protein